MKTCHNNKSNRYAIRLLIYFTGLIFFLPALGNSFVKINTGSIGCADFSTNNPPADTITLKRTVNLPHLSSPRMRRPSTLRSRKSIKHLRSIKHYRKTLTHRKKRFGVTGNHHRKQLYTQLGNAVQMKDLHFRLNALAPAAPNWKAAVDSVLQPYINGTETYDSILVVGYTDNTGSKKTNLLLSAKRAANIMAYLVQQGISENRIYIVAMGEDEPVSNNKSIEGRNLNRRVEINFLRSS